MHIVPLCTPARIPNEHPSVLLRTRNPPDTPASGILNCYVRAHPCACVPTVLGECCVKAWILRIEIV